jgi:hypothetical protein
VYSFYPPTVYACGRLRVFVVVENMCDSINRPLSIVWHWHWPISSRYKHTNVVSVEKNLLQLRDAISTFGVDLYAGERVRGGSGVEKGACEVDTCSIVIKKHT